MWQTRVNADKHSGGTASPGNGRDGAVKANYCADNDRNLKGAWSGLELARFARVLSAAEKITAFESVDTRRGRSVLQELKGAELPSYRCETFPFVRCPTKAPTSNFVAHFARSSPPSCEIARTRRAADENQAKFAREGIFSSGYPRSHAGAHGISRLWEIHGEAAKLKSTPKKISAWNVGVFWVTQFSNWPIQIERNILTWFRRWHVRPTNWQARVGRLMRKGDFCPI